jgi:hypothetical protein
MLKCTCPTPIPSAISRARPLKTNVGFPEANRPTAKSFHVTPPANPVPNAFIPASFAANRPASRSAQFAFDSE